MLQCCRKSPTRGQSQIKHKLCTIPSQSQHVTAFYFKKIDFSGFNVPFFASLLLSSFEIKVIFEAEFESSLSCHLVIGRDMWDNKVLGFFLLEIPLNHCCMFLSALALVAIVYFIVLSPWYYSSCLQALYTPQMHSLVSLPSLRIQPFGTIDCCTLPISLVPLFLVIPNY